MKRLLAFGFFATILAAPASAAILEIVTPPPGAQLFGRQAVELRLARPADRVNLYVDGVLVGVIRSAPWRLIHDFGDSPASRTILAEAWFDGFQTVERAGVTSAGMTLNDTLTIDLVEVPVKIRGARTAIAPSDLRVRENGAVQSVREIRADRPATSFLFVVDRSLSMSEGRLDAAMAAVRSALGFLRPGDGARLVLFNHRAESAVEISGAESLDRVRTIAPAGGTSVRDTLASISTSGRTVVVVISDGGDRNSVISEEKALRAVARQNIALYAVTLGGGAGLDFLSDAAQRTGGTVTRSSARTLQRDVEAIMDDVNSRYTVVYQSTLTGRGWRAIDIVSGRPRIDVFAARRGYFAE